jgi:hypothetical protein
LVAKKASTLPWGEGAVDFGKVNWRLTPWLQPLALQSLVSLDEDAA